ncbi:MAG: PIN domain-containing protein [Nitrospinae bacterium]|nr:PIN domain-containing protein [Nitrospinota bacterium]
MLLLDADVLIDVSRNVKPAVAWLYSLDEKPALPGLVVMELMKGSRDSSEMRAAVNLVNYFDFHWPTEKDCRKALEILFYASLSHNMGVIDTLIAAIAIGLNADLCTFNEKHFKAVPELRIIKPYLGHG